MSAGRNGPRRLMRLPQRTSCKARSMRWLTFRRRNKPSAMALLSIDSLGDAEIADILERAELYFSGSRGRRQNERLHGRIVFNVFYENSTRTAMSFATAAHRLGA